MTENEKITINGKEVTLYREVETNLYRFSKDAVDMLLEALEEREQYRAIGTIEEFKVLKAKVAPKKPIPLDKWGEYHECPVCGKHAENSYGFKYLYCPNCGCKYDWSE